MRDRFLQLIWRELDKIDENDASQRQAVYDRMHRALVRGYAGGSQGSADPAYLEASLDLDDAIAEVEDYFHAAPKGRVERAVGATTRGFKLLKLRYGAFAGALTFLGDLLKPVVELTQPVLIGSVLFGGLLLILRRFAGGMKAQVTNGAQFCGVLFVCSAALFGLQNAVPNAKTNGAIAEIVPGAGAVQNALLAALGRIEAQSQRTADILERQEKRQLEEKQKAEEQATATEQATLKEHRDTILAAGYSLDAEGVVKAYADQQYMLQFHYQMLKIRPTEEATRKILSELRNPEFANLIGRMELDAAMFPFGKGIVQQVKEKRNRLSSVNFNNPETLGILCQPSSYAPKIDEQLLARICARDRRSAEFLSSLAVFVQQNY